MRKLKKDHDKLQRALEARKAAGNVMGQVHKASRLAEYGLVPLAKQVSKFVAGSISEEQKAENRIREDLNLPIRENPTRVEKISNALYGLDEQAKKEQNEILDSSILNRQTRSTELNGVIDLHITVGEQEQVGFATKQDSNKKLQKPVFVKIKKDLSGKLKKKIFIWYCIGSGKTVFTAITPHRAPANHKDASANSSRLFGMKLAGMTVVGHDELQLELHCFSAMIAGTSAPAIDAIDLSRTLEEEAEYEKREFDRVQPGLRGFGLANVQIWTHSKKFQKKPVLSQLAHAKLHREEWWDARVELVMNSFRPHDRRDPHAAQRVRRARLHGVRHGRDAGLVREPRRARRRRDRVPEVAAARVRVRRHGARQFRRVPRVRVHVLHVREGRDDALHLRHDGRREALVHRRAQVLADVPPPDGVQPDPVPAGEARRALPLVL